MILERLRGSRRKALDDLKNEALVLELKNGKVFGGRLDEYFFEGRGAICVYSCKFLDKKNRKWRDCDPKIREERHFWLSEIRTIRLLPEKHREKILELEDVLQIYIDPHYKPMMGIECHWDPGRDWRKHRHQVGCDFRLHEALSFVRTYTTMSSELSKEAKWRRRYQDSFAYVRHRLLMYGAQIP